MGKNSKQALATVLFAALLIGFAFYNFLSEPTPQQWQKIGLDSLAVRSIAVDYSDGRIIYAGTDSGVYKSTNEGASWVKWGLVRFQIGDIVLHPIHPGIIYVGTENGGVWVSEDGANKWSPVGKKLPIKRTPRLAVYMNGGLNLFAGPDSCGVYRHDWYSDEWKWVGAFRDVRRFEFVSRGTLGFTSTSKGLWRSDNGGASWVRLPEKGLPNPLLFSVCTNPLNPLVLYVAPDTAGVYKTEDGGASWRKCSVGLPAGVTVMAVLRDGSGVLFAGLNGAGVYRSTDGGDSWTPINEGLDDLRVCLGAIAADPDGLYIYLGTERGLYHLQASGRPLADFIH